MEHTCTWRTYTYTHIRRVGQNHLYGVYTEFLADNHQIYGHIWCNLTVLANPTYTPSTHGRTFGWFPAYKMYLYILYMKLCVARCACTLYMKLCVEKCVYTFCTWSCVLKYVFAHCTWSCVLKDVFIHFVHEAVCWNMCLHIVHEAVCWKMCLHIVLEAVCWKINCTWSCVLK